jgi:hypothetical protein
MVRIIDQSAKLAVVRFPQTIIFWSGQPYFKSLLAQLTNKNLQKLARKYSSKCQQIVIKCKVSNSISLLIFMTVSH